MAAQAQIEGGWNDLKGKVKKQWGQLQDDELKQFEGNVDEFVGLLQRKTGETREQIETALQEIDKRFKPYLKQAAATAREYVDAAGDAVNHVRDSISHGQAEAEQFVQQRPMESVAVAFGTGLITGIVVGLLIRSR